MSSPAANSRAVRSLIDVEVDAVAPLSARVREYRLCAVDRRPLPAWEAGAHLEVHFDPPQGEGMPTRFVRHYSLVRTEDDDGRLAYRIAVQRDDAGGGGSVHIHALWRAGTRLRVSQPLNHFPLDRRDRHALLIAGGIGVTPIVSMARSLHRRGRTFDVLAVARRREQMPYLEPLARWAGRGFRLHLTGEGQGRPDLQALLAAQPEGTHAYVCGPEGLIEGVRNAARALGWSSERVRAERFGAGPRAGDRPFEVVMQRSARCVRVGAGTSALDALAAAGADVLWDCRRGECGLCVQKVLESDGPLEHRDLYLDQADRAAGDAMCICVSRVRGSRLVLDL